MSDSSKVLKVVFIILLIVVFGELFYFYYSTKKPSDEPALRDITVTNFPKETEEVEARGFVSKELIDYLSTRERIDGYRLYFEEQKEGVVSDLSFKKYTANGFEFEGSFAIINSKGEVVQKFGMTKNRLDSMKFYKIVDDKKVLFDFYDLKSNQKIKYIFKSDLTTVKDPKNNPDGDVITSEFIVE